MIDLGGNLEAFLCQTFRQALGLIREALPLVDFEAKNEVLETVAEHLGGGCHRRGCQLCQIMERLS